MKAAEAARNICAIYGDNVMEESMVRNWFSRIKEARFDISDTPCSGRPSVFEEDRLNTLIHNDPRQSTRELAIVIKTVTIPQSSTFAFNGQCSKIGCMGTACSKPKPQKSAGGHICIPA